VRIDKATASPPAKRRETQRNLAKSVEIALYDFSSAQPHRARNEAKRCEKIALGPIRAIFVGFRRALSNHRQYLLY